MYRTPTIGLLTAILFAYGPALAGQGWIEPVRPGPGWGIQKLRSAVSVTLSGRVANVTVEEWFQNRGAGLGEGDYHYPVPDGAAFGSFSLWQGDTELRGETMDATQARSIYEEIVRRKRDPALIELAGHGLIRARVFPINPGETRKITLRYTQILDRQGDAWRFRYAAGTGPGAAGAAQSFRLTTDSAGRFGNPYSPTHQVRTQRHDDRLEITLADSAGKSGDLDLFLPLARPQVGLTLVTHRPPGEDGYFMLLVAPGAARETAALRRDVVAVVDVSGSMSGEKLAQAKAALEQLLGSLRPGDRFRLIAFENAVRRYATEWTAANPENRRRAVDWVRALEAGGGTNIAGALDEAYAVPPADGALGVVVFLTDGLPTVAEQDPERIAARAEERRGEFRVFSFGIGFDVNAYLLDRLTERARGRTEYITPGGDIERAVGTLTSRIASPVLADVALDGGDGVELYDVQPQALPDLFAGDEVVVFGRYRPAGTGDWTLSVRGRRGGAEERFRSGAATAGTLTRDDYIPKLWATRKAGALSREIRLHGQTTELTTALKELALRYGILTEYTSYLVQEPEAVVTTGAMSLSAVTVTAAPAPRDQAGAGAVARSQAEAKAAEQAVVVTDGEMVTTALRGRAGINPTRRAGGRLFILRDSVWTDLGHGDSLPVISVAPFSDAYFALLRAVPELRPAALLGQVLVAGRRVSIKIAAGGKEAWRAGELEALVRDFRS
ncbi:MAG: VIT domain-containing protein [Gemmatimonadota bacterium]